MLAAFILDNILRYTTHILNLREHYVPGNKVYQNHIFIINNLEIYSKICGICILTVPNTLW